MASNEEYSISGLSETGSGAAAPSVDGGDSKHLAHSAQSNGLKELDTLNFPDGGARAWWVAAGNGGVMFCTLGFINTFGVFQNYYETHQLRDRSSSNIAWIGSLQTFFIFAGGLFGGPLFDRKGEKVIYIPAVVYIFSIFMTSICKEYYQFILSQGILGGVAMGMVMSPSMAATPQYFHKKRGAAMGIAIAGSSIGGTIFPIALSKMFPNPRLKFGWSRHQSASASTPDEVFRAVGLQGASIRLSDRCIIPDVPWCFSTVFLLAELRGCTWHEHAAVELLDRDFERLSTPGQNNTRLLADKFGRMNMLFAAGISSGILALCWQKCTTNAAIIVFTALFGFFSGAIISGVSIGLASCPKDPKNIGTYMGMGMAIAALALLAGPPICGALVVHYHSYDQVAIFSGVVILAGGFTVLLAKQASEEGVLGKV